jgi:hypothetical protein
VIMESPARRRICLALGASAIGLFLVLRGFNLYGDPRPWKTPAQVQATQAAAAANSGAAAAGAVNRRPPSSWISFLNTNKYPASLLFLLMTLGPMFLAFPFLEDGGRVTSVLTTFGRVPFFYYVLHIPLIHLAAILVSFLRTGSALPWLFLNHPVMIPPAPEGYVWSLGLLYLVTVIVVLVLYFPCRWFAGVKQRRKGIHFLSYL